MLFILGFELKPTLKKLLSASWTLNWSFVSNNNFFDARNIPLLTEIDIQLSPMRIKTQPLVFMAQITHALRKIKRERQTHTRERITQDSILEHLKEIEQQISTLRSLIPDDTLIYFLSAQRSEVILLRIEDWKYVATQSDSLLSMEKNLELLKKDLPEHLKFEVYSLCGTLHAWKRDLIGSVDYYRRSLLISPLQSTCDDLLEWSSGQHEDCRLPIATTLAVCEVRPDHVAANMRLARLLMRSLGSEWEKETVAYFRHVADKTAAPAPATDSQEGGAQAEELILRAAARHFEASLAGNPYAWPTLIADTVWGRRPNRILVPLYYLLRIAIYSELVMKHFISSSRSFGTDFPMEFLIPSSKIENIDIPWEKYFPFQSSFSTIKQMRISGTLGIPSPLWIEKCSNLKKLKLYISKDDQVIKLSEIIDGLHHLKHFSGRFNCHVVRLPVPPHSAPTLVLPPHYLSYIFFKITLLSKSKVFKKFRLLSIAGSYGWLCSKIFLEKNLRSSVPYQFPETLI